MAKAMPRYEPHGPPTSGGRRILKRAAIGGRCILKREAMKFSKTGARQYGGHFGFETRTKLGFETCIEFEDLYRARLQACQ